MKSEKYKGVYFMKGRRTKSDKDKYVSTLTYKNRKYSIFDYDERKCAFRMDMKRIELGLEPINILIRK